MMAKKIDKEFRGEITLREFLETLADGAALLVCEIASRSGIRVALVQDMLADVPSIHDHVKLGKVALLNGTRKPRWYNKLSPDEQKLVPRVGKRSSSSTEIVEGGIGAKLKAGLEKLAEDLIAAGRSPAGVKALANDLREQTGDLVSVAETVPLLQADNQQLRTENQQLKTDITSLKEQSQEHERLLREGEERFKKLISQRDAAMDQYQQVTAKLQEVGRSAQPNGAGGHEMHGG